VRADHARRCCSAPRALPSRDNGDGRSRHTLDPPARQSTPDQTRSRTMPPVTTNKHPWSRRNTLASAESCRLPTNRDPNDAFRPPDLSANSVHQLLRAFAPLSRSPVHTHTHTHTRHLEPQPTRTCLCFTRSPACPVPVTPGFSSPPSQFSSRTLHACLPACAVWGAHCHWSPSTLHQS